MLRNPASRAILRSFANVGAKPARPMINGALQRPQLASQLCTLSSKRPQRIAVALNRSVTATFQRHASSAQPPHFDKVNTKAEDKLAHQKLEAHPELVSSTSSIHPLNSEIGVQEQEKEVDMLAGMRSDLVLETCCIVVGMPLLTCVILEDHRRDLQPSRRTTTGLCAWTCRCHAIPCNFSFNRLLRVGD